ncbi:MAG: shikimate dehydrogenase [Mycobacteriaceae bacterium]
MSSADLTPRRAAVIGSPVAHSRSPVLHRAAYAALGLTGWSYGRVECEAAGVAALVASLAPEWVGLSVTMPAKLAALAVADTTTARARAVGAANTLVRRAGGWHADCTDVDGIGGALDELGCGDLHGARCVLVGAGGTARAALVALAGLGAAEVDLVARDADRAAGALACGQDAGLVVRVVEVGELDRVATGADVAVSTVPAAGSAAVAEGLARCPRVLDVLYDPWPTPVATAVRRHGGRVGGGLSVLLHQAYGQVELFTGRPAPREAMAAALKT